MLSENELDNPVWAALTGPQREHGVRYGAALRYEADISRFAAIEDSRSAAAWRDLRELSGGEPVALIGVRPDSVLAGWEHIRHLSIIQMVDTSRLHTEDQPEPDIEELAAADVDEMLRLIQLTNPGPFLRRTIELGRYLGVRAPAPASHLIAMAGQRIATPGWRETSAVCTDPDYRGHGYARRLVTAIVEGHARAEPACVPPCRTAQSRRRTIRIDGLRGA